MSLWEETFVSLYEPVMTQHAFRRNGCLFHRLVNNEIVQLLTCNVSPYTFSVRFDLFPLCTGGALPAGDDLLRLELLAQEDFPNWDVPDGDPRAIVADSLRMVQNVLLPYFERIVDYKSYTIHMVELYRSMFGMHGATQLLASDALCAASLAVGNDIMAEESLKLLERWLKALQRCGQEIKKLDPDAAEAERQPRRTAEEYAQLREAVLRHDRDIIAAFLRRSEAESRASYERLQRGE